MHKLLLYTGLLGSLLITLTATKLPLASAPASRTTASPNVVLILADDLGWTDLACYGNPYHETPNIDKLARGGARFTQAYSACNVCSPSRAAILTGRSPARLHLTDYIPGRDEPGTKLLEPAWTNFLRHEEVTLAELLKANGYVTASIGKWHLGQPSHYPDSQGFDVNFAGGWWGSHQRIFAPYGQPPLTDSPNGEYLTDRLTQEAIRFVEQNQARPFFLYLPHYAVHTPIDAKPATIAKYTAKPQSVPIRKANYAAMLEDMDTGVGELMATLDRLQLRENTLVIFVSDNGGAEMFNTTNAPLREGKATAYEGGIRVPMIVNFPGRVRAGRTIDTPVIGMDLLPTVCGITKVPLPASLALEGANLSGLLLNNRPLNRQNLYWHYPHYVLHYPTPNWAPRTTPHGAIRQGNYKLIEYYEDNRLELYNLQTDLSESKNLAKAQPQKAAALRSSLHQWLNRVGAQMPVANPNADTAVVINYVTKRLWKPLSADYKQYTDFKQN